MFSLKTWFAIASCTKGVLFHKKGFLAQCWNLLTFLILSVSKPSSGFLTFCTFTLRNNAKLVFTHEKQEIGISKAYSQSNVLDLKNSVMNFANFLSSLVEHDLHRHISYSMILIDSVRLALRRYQSMLLYLWFIVVVCQKQI